jgi:RNA polymerase sigma factor (sigma-70 family)
VRAAQRGDELARAELVDAFVPLIATVARIYRRSAGISRVELMQEGVAGLLVALQRYEPARGTPFWAYASWWVRHGMQQLVAELTRPVVLSDRALRQLARVRDARSAYVHAHRVWPSTAELAAATGLPQAQVQQLVAVERAPRALAGGQGPDGRRVRDGQETLVDPGSEDAYEAVITRLEGNRIGALLGGLEERERVVLRARYGLDGPAQTLRTIAGGLGLSAERVRQIERQALEELRVAAEGA